MASYVFMILWRFKLCKVISFNCTFIQITMF